MTDEQRQAFDIVRGLADELNMQGVNVAAVLAEVGRQLQIYVRLLDYLEKKHDDET